MSNKLYLLHRPTGERVQLAQRGNHGWRPAWQDVTGRLANMLQRATNQLNEGVPGDQDDFTVVLDEACSTPLEEKVARRERKIVTELRQENEALRAGLIHLIELLELRALGEEIFHHEILGGVHPRRVEFLERKGITWVKAIAWRDQFAEKLRGWLAGK